MKKYILAALLAIVLMPSALADAPQSYSLLVNTADGNSYEYAFEYLPVATFEGDEMIISDDRSSKSARYAMENVVNMTFKSEESGVNEISEKNPIKIYTTNDILTVSGVDAGAKLAIYDAAGKLVASAAADSDGVVSVNIGNLVKGVFVVALPKHSFKFIR